MKKILQQKKLITHAREWTKYFIKNLYNFYNGLNKGGVLLFPL